MVCRVLVGDSQKPDRILGLSGLGRSLLLYFIMHTYLLIFR